MTRTLPTLIAAIATITVVVVVVEAQDSPRGSKEHDAIRAAVLDYPEGWYEGNGERMERSLHPALAKRAFLPDRSSGKPALQEMTAEQLISATARGSGKRARAERRADIEILDVFGNVASVKIVMNDWIDYAHVLKVDGKWKIINVLWEPTPEAKKRWFGEAG